MYVYVSFSVYVKLMSLINFFCLFEGATCIDFSVHIALWINVKGRALSNYRISSWKMKKGRFRITEQMVDLHFYFSDRSGWYSCVWFVSEMLWRLTATDTLFMIKQKCVKDFVIFIDYLTYGEQDTETHLQLEMSRLSLHCICGFTTSS